MNKIDQKKSQSVLLKTAVASSMAVMFVAAPVAAQMTIQITDGQTTSVFDPGTGNTVNAAEGVTQTIADTPADDDPDNGNIVLDGSSNDQVTVINAGTLINEDTQDENVVIFIDNAEDQINITNTATGTLSGVNGVLFFEGDEATLVNDGLIEGTGVATEGVVYFDRDADSNVNTITNSGTITGVGGATIGVDALLDTATLVLTNTGDITNSGTDGNADAININGDPGSTNSNTPFGPDITDADGDGNITEGTPTERGCSESEIDPDARAPIAGTEGSVVNCQHNLTIDNSGTISTDSEAGSTAAIRIEEDAVVTGSITNSGSITGAANGIFVNGAHSCLLYTSPSPRD